MQAARQHCKHVLCLSLQKEYGLQVLVKIWNLQVNQEHGALRVEHIDELLT